MTLNLLGHQHGPPESLVRRLHAAVKLAAGFVIILGTVLVPASWTGWFLGTALLLLLLALISRVPLLFLLKRLAVLSPFVLGVALVSALQPGARANWVTVLVRSGLCLTTVVLLSNTTPFSEVLRVLRRIRVPGLLITTLALMHRYLFVLVDEAERMRRARASRTFTRRKRTQWHTLSTVGGQLFVRASERAERIYSAMCARGWK